jgi:hypothetical protein
VADEVVRDLDPNQGYGVWWFGETRIGSSGRRKKRDDTIPVPVPLGDAIPREWVEPRGGTSRRTGGGEINRCPLPRTPGLHLLRCLRTEDERGHNNGYFYYTCMARRNHGKKACPDSKTYRADGRKGAERIIRLG